MLCYVLRQPTRPYVWLGRSGETVGTLGESSFYRRATLSPDGQRAAVSVTSPRSGTQDLYLIDIARETATRLTHEESSEGDPVWSPDGQKIAFYSDRNGPPDVYILDVASGTEELLWSAPGVQQPTAWSPDGSEILMTNWADPERNFWLVPVSSESKPFPLAPPVSRAWRLRECKFLSRRPVAGFRVLGIGTDRNLRPAVSPRRGKGSPVALRRLTTALAARRPGALFPERPESRCRERGSGRSF